MTKKLKLATRGDEARETAKELADGLAVTIHILCKEMANCQKRDGRDPFDRGWNQGENHGLFRAVRIMANDLRDARGIERGFYLTRR